MEPDIVAAWISDIEIIHALDGPSQQLQSECAAKEKRRKYRSSPTTTWSTSASYPRPSHKRVRSSEPESTRRLVLGSLNANARWATAEGAMASNAPESKKNARGKDGSRAPGKADLSEIPGIARRTRNMMAAHQSLDDASAVSEGAAETTDTSRLSAYSRLLQSRDVPSLPPPSRASRAPSTHTTSTKRSSSPVKSPLDLLTSLGKPVQYDLVEESVILKKLKKDAIAPVYRRIRALCHAQYIPSPMRDSLEQGDHDSMVEDDQDGGGHDNCDDAGKSDDGQDSSGVIDLCLPDSDYGLPLVGPQRVALHPVLAAALPPQADRVLFQLKQEFIILQEIVSTTREYIRINHSEAAWNSAIHYPLLRLATAHMDSVTVQDITRASISSKCSPDGKEFGDSNGSKLALPPSTKMVDYALTLSAPSSLPKTSGPRGPVHPWMDFVGRQSVINPSMPSSFNHTEYSPLRYSPAGLFVETKVDMGSQIEGRTQLGVWVAAWFKRVNAFRLSKPVPPPVLPVLLVHNESWDLYFAVDRDSWIEILGKTTIGQTDSLPGIYKLLATLRELAGWMAGPFQDWVDRIVKVGLDVT